MNSVLLTFGFHHAYVACSGTFPEQLPFTLTVVAPFSWALLNECVVTAFPCP